MQEIRNWINGEWTETDWQERQDPLRKEAPYRVPRSGPLDLIKAISAASRAFVLWQKTSLEKRKELLFKVADLVSEHQEAFARLAALDQLIPLAVAREKDAGRASQLFRYYARADFALPATERWRVHRKPLGVVGVITAWPLPLWTLARELAPALLAGNTVVIKPSSRTPRAAFLLARLLEEAGLPKGVCNVVFGTSEIGLLLAAHPSVHAVSFTGRSETAPAILQAAAPQLKKVALHLSSKNSSLVLDLPTDLTRLARSCFEASGQLPWSISRIMVPESLLPSFLPAFKAEVEKLVPEDPQNESAVLGPLAFSSQPAKRAVQTALQEKGEQLTGTGPSEELWLAPTVITDLHNCSALHQEELLAPVVLIVPVKAAHEAIKWMNTTPYGLCASIWAQDLERAQKLAQNLDVGTVWLNGWDEFDPQAPVEGLKTSGLGLSGGEKTYEFYSASQTIFSATR